ncbi:MAG: dihydrodipicolinate synthase family protein [Paracoccaceae bacterium]|nr:dihydrodipicolinate synthase family protein [Paracoccaceae bacterium]MDE2914238.1 dihydrodipicolinate synthase family protein [Paracoccaceae bacterium]
MFRLSEKTAGVFVISATPFCPDGSLDLEGTEQLLDFYVGCGVTGITILGVMGEANKMTDAESAKFAERALRHIGQRMPVIVGVTHSALTALRDLSHSVMDLGASGVMLQPASGLKGDEAVFRYFEQVFDAIGAGIPVVYQDFPQASNVHLSPAAWSRMVQEFPDLVMLKHEDCPGLPKLSKIRDMERQGIQRRVSILIGNNGLYFPQELHRGADGAMTGFAFPDVLVKVYDHFLAGRADVGEDLFDRYLPLNRYEQQLGFGLPVRKEILRRRGALRHATARKPVYRLTDTDFAEIDRLMARVER